MENKDNFFTKYLNRVERVGNALPHPATLFFILTLVVIVISAILANLGTEVSYTSFDSATQEMVEHTVAVNNLLSAQGIQHMVTTVVSNFTGFFALGTVIVVMLGVGVAEGSGMMSAVLRKLAQASPSYALTSMVIFLGVMSNVAGSAGYVVLVPLGALLYKSYNRHPIAGLAAAFAGVSGGWAANLFLGTNDPVFAGITTQAANILDPSYMVEPTSNWYFSIVSTFMIVIVGTLVNNKIVEPRLGVYSDVEESVEIETVSELESRGLFFALISWLIYIAIILFMLIPQDGVLRNPETQSILVRSPFMTGLIFFMMLFFLIPGIAYGFAAKTFKSEKDVIEAMIESTKNLSGFIVLIFFAAQFVGNFTYSNLGTVISVKGAELLVSANFVGLPLIIFFIILVAIINIFMAVDTAKWALMAPIFVPMFMQVGLSPELTQIAYRVGDSSTNVISPLMPFFALIVAFAQKYDKEAGIGTLISTMLPYSIAFLFSWILLISGWYLLGLPLGPGAGLTYGI